MQQSYSRQQLNAEWLSGRTDKFFRGLKPSSEDHQQANFFAWIDYWGEQFPKLKTCYAEPNGSNKSKMQRYVMSITGLRSGVPDVHLPIFSRIYYEATNISIEYTGLYIEFKSKKGVLSPNQKIWMQRLRDVNHMVEVCKSWQAAANLVIDYLGLPIEKLVCPK